MTLLKTIGQAITAVIQWIMMVFNSFYDFLGIPEWKIFRLAISIIITIICIFIFKRKK